MPLEVARPIKPVKLVHHKILDEKSYPDGLQNKDEAVNGLTRRQESTCTPIYMMLVKCSHAFVSKQTIMFMCIYGKTNEIIEGKANICI